MTHIVGLAEIVLWTTDKAQAVRFYHELLGLPILSPPTLPNVFLKAGEGHAGIPQMIVLVPMSEEIKTQLHMPPTGPQGNPAARRGGYQLHHLAFEVPEEEFDAQYQTFVAAGIQPRSGKHPVLASRTMYIDDPDGNEVEFICRAPVA